MAAFTWLERSEIAIGGVLICTSMVGMVSSYDQSWSLSLADIFRWAAVILLGQGLLRDLAIMIRDRRGVQAPRMVCLCFESSFGVLLLVNSLLLYGFGSTSTIEIPITLVTLLVGGWWFVGFFVRHLVITIRHDPHHHRIRVW